MSIFTGVAVVLSLLAPAGAVVGEGQAALDEAAKTQVRNAIQQYVERDVKLKESFLVLDPRTGEPLRLAFDNVHAGVKPHENGHLACVDFKDRAGKVHDVDVVVGKAGDAWRVEKVFLHKVEGMPVTAK